MRDGNGTYLGESRCRHWKGVVRHQEAECCGGRKFDEVVLLCGLKGELRSAACGRRTCKEVDESPVLGV
jgi:hypothetical protein